MQHASRRLQSQLSHPRRSACPQVSPSRPRLHLQAHLFEYGVDPIHLAVDHVALLLTPVHLLDDAPELGGVRRAADGASGDLPVVSYRRLHDGLQYGEPYGRQEPKRESTTQRIRERRRLCRN